MLDEPVAGKGLQLFFRLFADPGGIESGAVLADIRIATESAHPEAVIEPAHGGVSKKGQGVGIGKTFFKGGGEDRSKGRRHEGRHRLDAAAGVKGVFIEQHRVAGVLFYADRVSLRQYEQFTALGQGDDICQFRSEKPGAAASCHLKLRKILDFTFVIGKYQAGQTAGMLQAHAGIKNQRSVGRILSSTESTAL